MKLPQKLPLELLQTRWATYLDPVISQPILDNNYLKNVVLVPGKNVISHGLGRRLEGWNPTRVKAPATFYDEQDSNPTPNLTLVLYASADCVVDLLVF